MALARTSYPVHGIKNASHAIEMLAVPGRRVRRRWAPKIFGRLLAAIVNGSDQASELKGDSTTLTSERLVTTCHEISRALSPEHHSAGLAQFRCSLCGSPSSPQGIHVCPRLYGR
jgi:hypothetical protein